MSAEIIRSVNDLHKTFADFKVANDARLKEIEAKGRADPLTEAKVDKLSAAVGDVQKQVDDLTKVSQRRGTGAPASNEQVAKHREAFGEYMRLGNEAKIRAAVSIDSDKKGGYAVPETLDEQIEMFERDNVPMRELCNVLTVSNENYEKLVNQGGTSLSGWVGEREARTATGTPDLAALRPYFGEIYANPGASQTSLDDMMFDVEAWLASEVSMEFAEQENDAFTRGNGVKKPKGILEYTLSTSVDGTRTFQEIQKVHSGSSGAFVADKLIDLVYALKRGYRKNARWMISALGVAAVRKLKDGQNNYLFQPSYIAGQPQTLLGYPIEENDDVPEPAADANAAIFGDFRRAYTIVDVRGTRVLRDPYYNKPFVHFYTTKRVGGFVVNDRAVKVYKLSA